MQAIELMNEEYTSTFAAHSVKVLRLHLPDCHSSRTKLLGIENRQPHKQLVKASTYPCKFASINDDVIDDDRNHSIPVLYQVLWSLHSLFNRYWCAESAPVPIKQKMQTAGPGWYLFTYMTKLKTLTFCLKP
jgi:hypothetical protein